MKKPRIFAIFRLTNPIAITILTFASEKKESGAKIG